MAFDIKFSMTREIKDFWRREIRRICASLARGGSSAAAASAAAAAAAFPWYFASNDQ